MDSIVKYACEELGGAELECIMVKDEPWFKAKQIVTVLDYNNTKRAVQTNVDDEDKKPYKDLVVTSHGSKSTPLGRHNIECRIC